jgi:hypothetical protein
VCGAHQKRTNDWFVTLLDKDRRSHCGGRAKAADMIVMVRGDSDILHWLGWKLLLNRTKQRLGLRFRVR